MIIPNPIRFVAAMSLALWYWMRQYQLLVTPKEYEVRDQKCDICPFNVNGQCVKCSCLLAAKISLASEQCPIKRWKRVKRKKSLTQGHAA